MNLGVLDVAVIVAIAGAAIGVVLLLTRRSA